MSAGKKKNVVGVRLYEWTDEKLDIGLPSDKIYDGLRAELANSRFHPGTCSMKIDGMSTALCNGIRRVILSEFQLNF